jgi:hypothetical protein
MTNIIPFPATRTTTASRARNLVRTVRAFRFDGEFNIGDRVRHALYGWDAVVVPDTDGVAADGETLVAVSFNGMVTQQIAVRDRDLVKLYSRGDCA